MKIQLQGQTKLGGATPHFQMAKKAPEPQKRKAGAAPVGFVAKKAKKAPAAASDEGAAGNMDPMQMMQMMMQMGGTGGDKMQMMQMMMQMMPMMMQMGGGDGAAAAPAKAGMDDNQWKCKFHELLNRNEVADKPVYSCEEIGEAAERCYKGSVAIQEHNFEAAAATVGKKEAQQLAAKAAMEMLFPDDYRRLSQSNQGAPVKAPKGQVPRAKAELQGKQLLNQYMNLYLWKNYQRSVKKDDVKFETEEVDLGGKQKAYVSTVALSEGLAGRSFQGEQCISKSDAEGSAADEAARQLASVFAPIAEERNAIKKQKNKESLEKLKEEHGKKKKQLAIKAEPSSS